MLCWVVEGAGASLTRRLGVDKVYNEGFTLRVLYLGGAPAHSNGGHVTLPSLLVETWYGFRLFQD